MKQRKQRMEEEEGPIKITNTNSRNIYRIKRKTRIAFDDVTLITSSTEISLIFDIAFAEIFKLDGTFLTLFSGPNAGESVSRRS